jgi:molecular chaperone GrpE
MGKGNSRPEVDNIDLDLEHELPASNDGSEDMGAADSGKPSAPASDLQKLQAEIDTLRDRMARMQAEFDNARKRTQKEQQEFRDYAAADAIKSLLPVLDSFERALTVKSEAAEFRSGVELIYKQLQTALEKLSLQPIKATGEQFNPHVHEAIEMVDTADVPDHQVIEELQRGYKIKDRLLRPAMVKVARNPGK